MAKPRTRGTCRGCGGDGFYTVSCQLCAGTGQRKSGPCRECRAGRVNVTCNVCLGTGRDEGK